MSHRWNSGLFRVPHLAAAALLMIASAPAAFAQDAPALDLTAPAAKAPAAKPAAPDAAAPAAAAAGGAPASAWIKECGQDPQSKKKLCITTQELRAETNQFIASLQLRKLDGDPKMALTAIVLTGQLIQPGLRVQVDDGKPAELKYVICDPTVCYAQAEVDDAFAASMKKGNKVVAISLNPQGKPMVFPFTLSGFTKVFEGEGLDRAAGKARRDALQEQLQKNAEENRQKLIEQQNKERGGSGN
ncbi:invasion associated locus B family protein [Kaistia dalseonensis]|uniref:Invasion protein IalB n=1 Tax=Kaistia dalseonensis TaxID=410840 RepID=A0ABU0H2K3_9HYPH|nr:invasion associated locus B family protein [Kaistia dalseonensis]MCX5493958.1 invasion associated locus B family protein [Kaistia dalseonensis]MDQ0436534.1 invasion protein IalB [Kaistia dalseonensis]